MAKTYNPTDDEMQAVGEAVMVYGGYTAVHQTSIDNALESSNAEKKAFLRTHLHLSTAAFLDSENWMENTPFPHYPDADDDAWIDAAEAARAVDIVDDTIIKTDRQAWLSLR